MKTIARILAVAVLGIAATFATASAAHAWTLPSGVTQVSYNTFRGSANCICSTTINGYVFTKMPYYDPSPEVDSAVELYWLLKDQGAPNLPPVTSISVDVGVSGTVGN